MVRHTSSTRIPEIDTVRGCMLVVMTLIHLPGICGPYVSRLRGFATSAEIFIFTSGFVLGAVVSSSSPERIHALQRKFLKRSLLLYLAQVAAVLCILTCTYFAPQFSRHWREFGVPTDGHRLAALLASLLFLYQPRYLDPLPLFVGFAFFVPAIIQLLSSGRYQLLLLTSVLIWGISQFYDFQIAQESFGNYFGSLYISNQSPFRFLSWQLLFVLGAFTGDSRVRSIISKGRYILSPIASGTVITCLLWSHSSIQLTTSAEMAVFLIGKENLGLLRIVEVLSLAYLYSIAVRKWPGLLHCCWLSFLGRHSLSVYLFHVVVLYGTAPFRADWHTSWSWEAQLIATTVAVSALTLGAQLHVWWRECIAHFLVDRNVTYDALRTHPITNPLSGLDVLAGHTGGVQKYSGSSLERG